MTRELLPRYQGRRPQLIPPVTELSPNYSRLSLALVSPEYGVGALSTCILNHIKWNNTYKFVKSI